VTGMARRIGLFGGTFDPIHVAHLAIAEWTREDLGLEKVVFIPNRIPPHKTTLPVSDSEHRLRMLELAISGNPTFEISAVELQREGPSYMVDTLRAFRESADYAAADLFLIIGSDSLASFHEWHKAGDIQHLCVLVAYPRVGARLEKLRTPFTERAILLKAPLLELASSDIRKRLSSGRSIRYLVPEPVHDYIQRKGIYKSN
jgi:nicotinate-nucleotide adenylyltransferase